MAGPTLSSTVNYSGMLYTKTDESTRFLDAIYARGRNGGRVTNNSLEFVLASGYDMDDASQPSISEQASLTAPAPETTERTQEYNVNQIFHRSIEVSYVAQSNQNLLSGVNVAGQENNRQNMLDFQIGRRLQQMKMDINYTMVNGVYQYTKGSTSVAPRTRGLLPAIQTNKFDGNAAKLTPNMINDVCKNAISNGADPTAFEIWVNPAMLNVITDLYAALPGGTLPATRTEGGIAISQILTPYAPLNINWEPNIPDKTIMFANIGQIAVSEKPYFDENGQMLGVLFYESLAKLGASERGQLYGELGCDYAAEWHHAALSNFTV